jgi:recombination protein RecA
VAKKEKEEKEKLDLKTLLGQMNKKYGKGAIGIAASSKGVAVPRIPFGVLALDYVSGGGVPYGRISGFHGMKSCGKTSNALRIAASAQKMCREHLVPMVPTEESAYICPECGYVGDGEGEQCPFCESAGIESFLIDIGRKKFTCPVCKQYNPMVVSWYDFEGAFCNPWAARFGLDCSKVILTRPECAEQGIDIIDGIMRTGEVDIFVIDSIACMTPASEAEDSAEATTVGLQARLINKMLRKFSAAMNKPVGESSWRPTVIMINQIRQKVACFEYNAVVTLADGSTEKIGKLVCQKYSGCVQSYNEKTGKIELKKVVGWHKNGKSADFLKFFVDGGNSGYRKFTVTPEHRIFTPIGESLAKDLKVGDFVSVEEKLLFSQDQHEILLGSMLGDGSLRFPRNSLRGTVRFGHGPKQKDYCTWKANALNCHKVSVNAIGNISADSEHTEELAIYKVIKTKKAILDVPQEFIDKLTAKSVAIWYMDDGTFSGSYKRWGFGKCSISAKKLPIDCMQAIADKIESLGMGKPYVRQGKGFLWSGTESEKFQKAVGPYVHSSMRYKLKPGMPDFCWEVAKKEPEKTVGQARVVSIDHATKTRRRYDITVEDNHNYFIGGGVLVHNCMYGSPDTLPGGLGQEFATSMDIKFNPSKLIDDKQGNPQYQNSTFRCIKNKCSVPHKVGAFRMWLDYDPDGHYPTDTEETGVILKFADKAELFGDSKTGWKLYDKEFKTKKAAIQFALNDYETFTRLREDLLDCRLGELDTSDGGLNVQAILGEAEESE